MAAADYANVVQQLYVSYFGRPADYYGLQNFEAQLNTMGAPTTVAGIAAAVQAGTNVALVKLVNSFNAAPESVALYGAGTTQIEISKFVAGVYTNVLGRPADVAGANWWINEIVSGRLTKANAALAISAGALTNTTDQGKIDAATITAKVAVASDFTTSLDTIPEINAFSGDAAAAAARAMLATVTNTTTVATFHATVDATIAALGTAATAGQTFTLTASADTLDPLNATAALKTTAGDDTFRAPTDGFLTSADYVDGGAGNDTLTAAITAAGQTIAPTLKSVENVTLTVTAADTKALTINAADFTGTTTVSIKDAGAVSMAGSDEKITVSNLAKTTTLGIIGGTASTGTTASEIAATFTGALAADTQKVAISSLGKVGVLTLTTAETVEITATGTGTTGANTIGSLVAGAVKTLNLKGAGDLTIAASDLAAVVTVDASTSTGVISFTGETAATSTTVKGGAGATTVITASTGTVSVTTLGGADTVDVSGGNSTSAINTGAGNDEVKVGASTNVTAADVIVGGEGTDTITVSDATINATTKTTLALGVSGFEVLKTTATAGVTVDFNALATYNTVTVAGVDVGVAAAVAAAAAANGTAGAASVAATMENEDALVLTTARTGQAGQAVVTDAAATIGGAGGAGVALTPKLDAGANIASLKFIGNTDLTGGAGGVADGANDTTGAGGAALNAANIETLNIDISGTNATGVVADTVTLTGGAFGVAANGAANGAAGSGVVVGTNATMNITSSLTGATATVNNHLDLGTVVGTNVTINASTFAGNLTVTAATGNVTIKGGLGNDVITGGAGTDTINGGAGADTLNGMAGADVYTGGAGRDSFAISNSGATASAFDTVSDFGKVSTALSTTQVATLSVTNAFGAAIATATTLGGAESDILSFAATSTLKAAASGTDVAAASVNAGKAITASISAKGLVTLAGADAALVDTFAEWIGVVDAMTTTNGNVAAFEFGGSTYVFQQAGATDTLVQLIGVTGVTGVVVAGSSVAAAVGDIFVA